MNARHSDTPPVVASLQDFDTGSGNWLERVLFNHRLLVIALCPLLVLELGIMPGWWLRLIG